MTLAIVGVDDQADHLGERWHLSAPAAGRGDGVVLVAGATQAVVAPAGTIDEYLVSQWGDDAALTADLACFVYHRKHWFAPGLDPLSLRDRRPGQYEVRVVSQIRGTVVPQLAMDLSPVRHAGRWATMDPTRANPATSSTEIAVVPSDQPVRIGGSISSLGDVDCSHGTVWEASRLASIVEILRLPGAGDDGTFVRGERRLTSACDQFLGLPRADRSRLAETARGMFGLAVAWAFLRLPVHLVIGLSQGDVVRRFTASLVDTDDEFHHPLALAGWHPDAAALRYAPGYFATGAVQGYSVDALAMARPALAAGHRRATGRGLAEAA